MPEFNNAQQALNHARRNGLSGAGILVRDDTKVVAISPSYSKPAFGTRAGSGMRYEQKTFKDGVQACLLYTSPSPRDRTRSRMPSSA